MPYSRKRWQEYANISKLLAHRQLLQIYRTFNIHFAIIVLFAKLISKKSKQLNSLVFYPTSVSRLTVINIMC